MSELLRELLRRRPFRPIRVVPRAGNHYDIVDPDRIASGKSKVFMFLPSSRMEQLSENEIELVYEPRRSRH